MTLMATGRARGDTIELMARQDTRTAQQKPADREESVTMTVGEARQLLGVSVWLGRRLAKAGQLPGAFMVGGLWRVHRATFHHELERLAGGEVPRALEPDEVLQRALGDVQMQLARRRAATGSPSS